MSPSESELKAIAAGANASYEHTFAHKTHGELTFKGALPTALQQMAHSVAVDNFLAQLQAPARGQSLLLAAALAGMTDSLLLEMPVIDRVETPDEDRGSVKVELVRYDPTAELDITFLADVWIHYSEWRSSLLTPETVEALGKS